MEEARLSIEHKEKEIEILNREKVEYALQSEENFRRAEQRLREKEDDIAHIWYRMETMKSYQVDKLNEKCVSNVAGDHPHYSDDCMPVTDKKMSDGFCDPHLTTEKQKMEYYTIYLPEYSQVAPLDVRGPSHTSTPKGKTYRWKCLPRQ